jgi:hypothetical protein
MRKRTPYLTRDGRTNYITVEHDETGYMILAETAAGSLLCGAGGLSFREAQTLLCQIL